MTNFIFKSQETYKKLCQQLVIIQSELRHQRSEHAVILTMLNKLVTNHNLQKQVDEYFDEDETSPQTDSENKNDLD